MIEIRYSINPEFQDYSSSKDFFKAVRVALDEQDVVLLILDIGNTIDYKFVVVQLEYGILIYRNEHCKRFKPYHHSIIMVNDFLNPITNRLVCDLANRIQGFESDVYFI